MNVDAAAVDAGTSGVQEHWHRSKRLLAQLKGMA
jgi:hypothetical protein